jgi:hypothetical protein
MLKLYLTIRYIVDRPHTDNSREREEIERIVLFWLWVSLGDGKLQEVSA